MDDAHGFRAVQRYDVVRVTLGLLLILAAILKGHQLATEPVSGAGIFESRWLLIAAVELELVFGLWLLAGFRPRATWWAALACFGVFAVVSAFKAITGADSCGCFGRVVVSPWYTLALDVGAIAALAFARPGVFNYEHHTVFSVTEFAAFAALLAVPLAAVLIVRSSATTLRSDGSLVGDGGVVILEPQEWVGRHFPLASYVNMGSELMAGSWIAVLYRHDCSKCHALIDQFAQEMRGDSASQRRIALSNFRHTAVVEMMWLTQRSATSLSDMPAFRLLTTGL